MNHNPGIYIHIPFCLRKCNYCAFLSAPSTEEERAAYLDALLKEINIRGVEGFEAGDEREFDTIYFGGGTPSVLSSEQIGDILHALRENFKIADDVEITLEANPGTLGSGDEEVFERLCLYRRTGVNRLSMGVQSLDDERLKYMGRIHDSMTVKREFEIARKAGFDNINLDIMFSVPGETTEDVLTDIREIAKLGPEHISFYSLQIEEGTKFHEMWENGELDEVDDETDRESFHKGCELLAELGYEHYEISNFAKVDESQYAENRLFGAVVASTASPYRSRHNSKYWNMTDYLAIGLGASGMLTEYNQNNELYENDCGAGAQAAENAQMRRVRYKNVSDMAEYIGLINSGKLPVADTHVNSEHDNISETLFTGLRRREGVRYDECFCSLAEDECFCSLAVGEGFGNRKDCDGDERLNTGRNETSRERFRRYYADVHDEAESFVRSGHLIIDEDGLRLTESGIDISNRIMSLFV